MDLIKKLWSLIVLFRKQRLGMNLIEVMISLGIVSGLALLVAQTTKNTNKISKKLSQDFESGQRIYEIIQTLRDKNSCKTSLSGVDIVAVPSPAGNLAQIIKVNSSTNDSSVLEKEW